MIDHTNARIDNETLKQWAATRADDCGRVARQLLAERAERAEGAAEKETYERWADEIKSGVDFLKARVAALEGALTPSAATKAAYIGEFTMMVTVTLGGEQESRRVMIPWTETKEIMKAIREYADNHA